MIAVFESLIIDYASAQTLEFTLVGPDGEVLNLTTYGARMAFIVNGSIAMGLTQNVGLTLSATAPNLVAMMLPSYSLPGGPLYGATGGRFYIMLDPNVVPDDTSFRARVGVFSIADIEPTPSSFIPFLPPDPPSPAQFYQVMQSAGVPVTQRVALNFLGGTLADNPTTGATDYAAPPWEGGDLGSNFISWSNGEGNTPTSGQLRFPSMTSGVGDSYTAVTTHTATGQTNSGAPRDLPVLRFFANPADNTSLVVGDPGMFFTILAGGENGAVGLSTGLTPAGQFANCYFGCRSDGLVFMNAARLGQPLSGMFERSDSIATEFAIRDEYVYNGTTTIRFGPRVTIARIMWRDTVADEDRTAWSATAGSQVFGDSDTEMVSVRAAQVVSIEPGSAPVIAVSLGVPSPPAVGFVLYIDPADSKLKAMSTNGTVTPIANF